MSTLRPAPSDSEDAVVVKEMRFKVQAMRDGKEKICHSDQTPETHRQ